MADFMPATPQSCGVVASHMRAIHKVCQATNTFLFLRPSTPATMRLIEAGFATKSMDVHDKSSNWGLTSGLVPCDQAFSKVLKGSPNAHPHYHDHGKARPLHLNLGGTFDTLYRQGHFEFLTEVTDGSVAPHGTTEYRHFYCPAKNANVNFAMRTRQGTNGRIGDVFWYWRAQSSTNDPANLVPLYVWGYDATPVTGDYDMWMVVPQVSLLGGDTVINSNKDVHGRSAANAFTSRFIKQLNIACGRVDKPVFNHGAEAQNVSFTQQMDQDRYLALFCPGLLAPIMVPRLVVGAALHDLLLRGYVAIRNPKWIGGSTLGIEDMADAASQFPTDRTVQAGVAARNQLETIAAQRIELAWYERKGAVFPNRDVSAWKERYNQLRFFRIISKASEMDDITELVILREKAFPVWGPGSAADARDQARDEARRLAREAEKDFGRTGFIAEGGGVSAVDQSRSSNQNVSKLRGFWENKKNK